MSDQQPAPKWSWADVRIGDIVYHGDCPRGEVQIRWVGDSDSTRIFDKVSPIIRLERATYSEVEPLKAEAPRRSFIAGEADPLPDGSLPVAEAPKRRMAGSELAARCLSTIHDKEHDETKFCDAWACKPVPEPPARGCAGNTGPCIEIDDGTVLNCERHKPPAPATFDVTTHERDGKNTDLLLLAAQAVLEFAGEEEASHTFTFVGGKWHYERSAARRYVPPQSVCRFQYGDGMYCNAVDCQNHVPPQAEAEERCAFVSRGVSCGYPESRHDARTHAFVPAPSEAK